MNHRDEIKCALSLGLDVESRNPNLDDGVVPNLTDEQVDWIASWLYSEGIGRLSNDHA